MTKTLATPTGILGALAAAHPLGTGDGGGDAKITAERLEMHLGHPAGVRLVPARVHGLTTVRRRRPLYLLPPRPALSVSRPTAMNQLRQSVLNQKITDLYGLDGVGKSALAASLVHALDLRHFPDGAVLVTGRLPYPDMLQALFDSFFESAPPVKVTPQQTQTYLHNLRALVVLDDINLTPQQTDPILDALDEASVLIIGPERTALGRGQAISLSGLEHKEAIALLEKRLGRELSGDETELADQICAALNGVPLAVGSVAAHSAQHKQTLSKLLADLQERKPWAGPGGDSAVGPALEQLVLFMDQADRRILTALAAFAGSSAATESVRGLAHLSPDEFQTRLQRLQHLTLVHSLSPAPSVIASSKGPRPMPRLALAPAYYHAVRTWLVDDEARVESINYYASQLGRGAQLPGEELFNLLGAIEDAAQYGMVDALKSLARAADCNLARLGWWTQWQHLLDLTRRAAQAGSDRGLEAWALHQMGSLLGASALFANGALSRAPVPAQAGEPPGERALYLLETAQKLRQVLGDQAGAALSGHNREVLERVLPASPAAYVAPEMVPEPGQDLKAQSALPEAGTLSEEGAAPPSKARGRRRVRVALLVALVLWGAIALVVRLRPDVLESAVETPGVALSWEFGEAWNAFDNETWTQQVRVVIEGDDGSDAYRFFVDDQPVDRMFQITMPLCAGAEGVIRVEAPDGESVEVPFKFDSPFCRE